MWTYLAGPILAFLPARLRAAYLGDIQVNWSRATVFSGIIESLLALGALIVWYSIFVTRAGQAIGASIPWPYAGPMGLLSMYMHPLTWLICYFGAEGVVRTMSGLATHEVPGTLPLVLLDRAIRYARTGEWRAKPRLVEDEVTRGEGIWDLKIASRNPKAHWKYPLTIRYGGEFFQVEGEEHVVVAGRPHIYFLQRLPSNEIIRGLEDYDPHAAFLEDDPPGFFATVYAEMRKKFAK
ncbi:MAG TPA: hypothetical protein VMV59_09420 [Candidatus Dormibacteraeota bacterium]|nr:hypothetical protein [Candidatus Dormibacteraeota bacterium]